MARVQLDNVRKVYDNGQVALAGASFEVEDGELLVLVGPSGCGKSTLLRMVAGLETVTGGTLSIGGRVVNDLTPRDRDIAMVFQSYALYPHMSVAGNLAFGLKLRGMPRADIERRVARASEVLDLSGLLERRPGQLSGGQRQRVALGRALVREPAVFLLDEPLSNLDARLRLSMRVEIARLHRHLGATMIYVTHDQVEAMTLGQRIVVLDGGVVQQIDTPMNLYAKPANLFVAGFIGSPAMNFLYGRLRMDGALARLEMEAGVTLALGVPPPALRAFDGRDIVAGLRPEDLQPTGTGAAGERLSFSARLEVVEPVGNEVFLNVRHAGRGLVVRVPPRNLPAHGSCMTLDFDPASLHFFDADTGRRIPTPARSAADEDGALG